MLTIIGCGNANRRDDAAGVVVARRLRERLERHPVPGVQAHDCGTAGVEVMFAVKDSDAVILIDASRTGAEPGAVFQVPGRELLRERPASMSLHDFRWDDALYAGQRIYGPDFADAVTVFLIEAEDLGFGLEMSEAVAAATEKVYRQLLERIAAYAVARHEAEEARHVHVRRGWIQVPLEMFEAFFDGREGVVPFALEGQLCLMPVQQVAGGLLVKLRNARGDRAIDAAELLRAHGWDDQGEYDCSARWESSLGALALSPPTQEAP